jgi:hypothetical protein
VAPVLEWNNDYRKVPDMTPQRGNTRPTIGGKMQAVLRGPYQGPLPGRALPLGVHVVGFGPRPPLGSPTGAKHPVLGAAVAPVWPRRRGQGMGAAIRWQPPPAPPGAAPPAPLAGAISWAQACPRYQFP